MARFLRKKKIMGKYLESEHKRTEHRGQTVVEKPPSSTLELLRVVSFWGANCQQGGWKLSDTFPCDNIWAVDSPTPKIQRSRFSLLWGGFGNLSETAKKFPCFTDGTRKGVQTSTNLQTLSKTKSNDEEKNRCEFNILCKNQSKSKTYHQLHILRSGTCEAPFLESNYLVGGGKGQLWNRRNYLYELYNFTFLHMLTVTRQQRHQLWCTPSIIYGHQFDHQSLLCSCCRDPLDHFFVKKSWSRNWWSTCMARSAGLGNFDRSEKRMLSNSCVLLLSNHQDCSKYQFQR